MNGVSVSPKTPGGRSRSGEGYPEFRLRHVERERLPKDPGEDAKKPLGYVGPEPREEAKAAETTGKQMYMREGVHFKRGVCVYVSYS